MADASLEGVHYSRYRTPAPFEMSRASGGGHIKWVDTLFDPKEHDDGNRQKGLCHTGQENRSPEVRIQTGRQEVRPGHQENLPRKESRPRQAGPCQESRGRDGRHQENGARQKGGREESRPDQENRREDCSKESGTGKKSSTRQKGRG